MNSKATRTENPRSVTTGVEAPKTVNLNPPIASVDWLQYSVEWPPDVAQWPRTMVDASKVLETALPPNGAVRLTGELLHPIQGYNAGMMATHARVFWHTLNRMQHIGVLMTGDDLRAILAIPYPHEALIRWCVAKSRKIARLDLALDVFDPRADPRDILHEWQHGHARTRARQVQELSGYKQDAQGVVQRASTIYVGARNSDRQLRVYDKAKQLGEDGPWIRMELQLRDAEAWAMAQSIARFGVGPTTQNALRNWIALPRLEWYRDALTTPALELVKATPKVSNTERWINEVCIPAIKRVMADQIEANRWELYQAIEGVLADTITSAGKEKPE